MLKWIFYATELLRRGGVDVERPEAAHVAQGFLQHYGWRSFFVDLTASPAVAAWFASHSFRASIGLQLCENADEEPVLLRVQKADYLEHVGIGNIYVLEKEQVRVCGHELVSLTDNVKTDCTARFGVQHAWLAGLFDRQTRIHPSAIAAHIRAPVSALKTYAEAAGFRATEDLFPSPEHDALLDNLLDLPRIKMEIPGAPIPTYSRSLEIPEYQHSFRRRLSPATTLYSKMLLSELGIMPEGDIWMRVPEEVFYASVSTDIAFPKLAELIRTNDVINIESDSLICLPPVRGSVRYEKGVSIRRTGDVVEVCGITVDYEGGVLSGAGVSMGYNYDLVGDRLIRRVAPSDCPCGDASRHELHLRTLATIEDLLTKRRVNRAGNVLQVHM
ncbi:MAG: hypothetical protein ACM30I_17330 [Gemmatimonas sp.]